MSSICCKKNGSPYSKHYDSPATIKLFEPVRLWLSKNTKLYNQMENPTNKYLANLVFQVLQFQEDAFGKNMKSSALTKLPIKCFSDFSPGGGLCHVLGALLKYKTDHGLRRFDFLNPSRLDRNVENLLMLEKTLIQTRVLRRPTVFFDKEIDQSLLSKLSDIVHEHHGTVTSDSSAASHIVHPQPIVESAQWITPILRRDKQCLVHFWGFPDSYDTWVSSSELSIEETFNNEEKMDLYHVHIGWLFDLDIYNEWMNELDYQVTTGGEWIHPSTAKRKGEFGFIKTVAF